VDWLRVASKFRSYYFRVCLCAEYKHFCDFGSVCTQNINTFAFSGVLVRRIQTLLRFRECLSAEYKYFCVFGSVYETNINFLVQGINVHRMYNLLFSGLSVQ
jgi:hypothetical protein